MMRWKPDNDILEKAVELRHELHKKPELSMQEKWTKAYLIDFIKENTSLQIVDRGKWFYCCYKKDQSKKNIAFRADFDAVPVEEAKDFVPYCSQNRGAAHKCGHDGHSAALAAFALVLDRYGAECNVYLLFQHAEETGQGAKECLPFLEENSINEIFAVHNMPGLELGAVAASSGVVQYASTGMILRFSGKKSHACYPEDGINPAYAMSEMILSLEELRLKKGYRGLTLITVIQVNVGEHAFGTSAGEGELLLTVRGEHGKELRDLCMSIEALAVEKAKKYGLQCAVRYEDEFEDCFNHSNSVDKIRRAVSQAGIPLQELKEPFRASEDFGRFTKQVPGAIFYVGAGVDHAALHTADYDFPDSIIETIVSAYRSITDLF
ncbi:MAG: amidohydrolase [Eubacteriales bacterium]|nr:amidohydrolase [Eubacteriales bacterium]